MTLNPATLKLRDYQEEVLSGIAQGIADGCRRQLVSLPTGCHARGQLIMRFDGRLVAVEDVKVGDLLMGPDSSHRRVLALARGRDEMVWITPVKGEPWAVNLDHILTLVRTTQYAKPLYPSQRLGGEIVDVSVREYLTWSATRKHIFKLFRVPVAFKTRDPLLMDPYLLGVLLGDGGLGANITLTTADTEVLEGVRAGAMHAGCSLVFNRMSGAASTYRLGGGKSGRRGSRIRDLLGVLGLDRIKCENKHVPHRYKTADRFARLEILAGLIDTDGSATTGGYDFISKSQRLAEDTAYLARSIGMAAYVTACEKFCQTGGGGTYYRVSISGDADMVPCRIPRKRHDKRLQKKSVLRTGFKITPAAGADYYGFSLDGDGRYLLGDFTVTHNSGKTVCFANLPRLGLKRILVIAHREELLDQAASKMRLWNPGLRVDVDQAARLAPLAHNLFEDPDAWAVCASIQTIGRKGSHRLTRYPASYFDAIVVDEGHRILAASYQSVLEHFHAGEPGGPLLLAVTATPFRGDGGDLSKTLDKIVYALEMPEAIERGILCPIRAVSISTSTSIETVSANREDFKAGELEDAVNNETRNQQIVKAYVERGADRQCMVFASGVAHSKALAAEFVSFGIPAEHVDGTTEKGHERPAINARFLSGETRVLVNVGTHTEGYDNPSVAVVILACPTRSGVRYCQCLGRGTRTWCPQHPDQYPTPCTCANRKDHLLVIDVFDQAGEHAEKLVCASKLFGIPSEFDVQGEDVMRVRKKVKALEQLGLGLEELKEARTMADLDRLEVRYREISVFWSPSPSPLVTGISKMPWISQGTDVLSMKAGDVMAWIKTDLLGHARLVVSETKIAPPTGEGGSATRETKTLTPHEYPTLADAVKAADAAVRTMAPSYLSDPEAPWRKKPASQKQLDLLKRFRVPYAPGLTSGQAGVLIDKCFARRGR